MKVTLNSETSLFFSGDPLDSKYVELRDSEVFPLAGEGLIAKQDIAPNTVFCLMNGNLSFLLTTFFNLSYMETTKTPPNKEILL